MPLKHLFSAIEDNDVIGAKKILESDSPADPSFAERMCHPLCDCQNCSELSAQSYYYENKNFSRASLDQVSSIWTKIKDSPKNTHRRGNDPCLAVLQFYWIRYDQTRKYVICM